MNFARLSILCVGDIMLDRYIHGSIKRMSPEAPVPVLLPRNNRPRLGGAANVASNITSLGARCVLVGLVGRDVAGEEISKLVAKDSRIISALVPSADRRTTCKTRFVAGQHQILRLDEECTEPATASEKAELVATIKRWTDEVQAVIISDYNKGTITEDIVAASVDAARRRGLPVFVDPKRSDVGCYRGATFISPNEAELALASGITIDNDAALVRASRTVMAATEAWAILVTRSENGMTLVARNGGIHSVAATARDVRDVCGAGDTAIAAFALAYADGQSPVQAMRIANAAAGVAVSKAGAATVDAAEVSGELWANEPSRTRKSRILGQDEIAAQVRSWKASGLTVGFTNGCFDIFHAGHAALLACAKVECDRLVVALNSDDSVRRLKGSSRPANSLSSRAAVMASIRHVDGIVSFEEDTPERIIRSLMPDVLFKGADYQPEDVVGAEIVQAKGGRVVLIDLVEGQSTTRILNSHRTGLSAVGASG